MVKAQVGLDQAARHLLDAVVADRDIAVQVAHVWEGTKGVEEMDAEVGNLKKPGASLADLNDKKDGSTRSEGKATSKRRRLLRTER